MGKGEGDVLVETEFTQSLAKLGFVTTDPLELFRFVDKDFSGEVTFAEFKAAMRSVGVQRVKEKASKRETSRASASSKTSSPRQQQRPIEEESDEGERPDTTNEKKASVQGQQSMDKAT